MNVADVLPVHHQWSGEVPHVVLASVKFVLARRYTCRQLRVALYAVLASLRMDAVKLRTDFLPADSCQHPSANVDYRHREVRDGVKVVHQGLNRRHVQNV